MIDLNMTIVAQFLNFTILILLLKKFAFKPLMRMLEEREMKIAKHIEAAEQSEIKAQKTLDEYQKQLSDARIQAQAIVDKAIKLADEERNANIEKTRAEIERMRKAAQEQIVHERELAVATLKGEVVSISMAAAAKIIGENMNTANNQKLVGEFIQSLDKEKIGGLPC